MPLSNILLKTHSQDTQAPPQRGVQPAFVPSLNFPQPNTQQPPRPQQSIPSATPNYPNQQQAPSQYTPTSRQEAPQSSVTHPSLSIPIAPVQPTTQQPPRPQQSVPSAAQNYPTPSWQGGGSTEPTLTLADRMRIDSIFLPQELGEVATSAMQDYLRRQDPQRIQNAYAALRNNGLINQMVYNALQQAALNIQRQAQATQAQQMGIFEHPQAPRTSFQDAANVVDGRQYYPAAPPPPLRPATQNTEDPIKFQMWHPPTTNAPSSQPLSAQAPTAAASQPASGQTTQPLRKGERGTAAKKSGSSSRANTNTASKNDSPDQTKAAPPASR